MLIACDEAGFTGPDLLAKDQRYFAFASVSISDEDAWSLISDARKAYPVQMPELKASRLMGSNQGRRLISYLVQNISGRFAINAHDKLLALCGWMFEYIFEPVFQDNPRIFYQKEFHKFIAMYSYLWFKSDSPEVKATLAEFQEMMRTKDLSKAPSMFLSSNSIADRRRHPFDLIRRFSQAHRTIIAKELLEVQHHAFDRGTWTLDLSISGLWSHLNHWGQYKVPLEVMCDDSKPLKAFAAELNGDAMDAAISRARMMRPDDPLGWDMSGPVKFADSRAHPAIQLADILASTVVHCYTNGLPDGFELTAHALEAGMLNDSIFPDLKRVDLNDDAVKVHYAVLHELVARAEGRGTNMPIEVYFDVVEQAIARGELVLE
ncbi:DUF3800 domain-containing protein [Paracoccus shandongensis]|uniref:DUF3800 domain-containing protein n=1 Tax=Paracoccus shandongensis TaxID=2816048 RepID=UPI001F35A7E4|nr:DUF3800 domain-containing protein [Paracoccus shandongensis]